MVARADSRDDFTHYDHRITTGTSVITSYSIHYTKLYDLKASIEQDREMPIMWGNGRLLLALAERS